MTVLAPTVVVTFWASNQGPSPYCYRS